MHRDNYGNAVQPTLISNRRAEMPLSWRTLNFLGILLAGVIMFALPAHATNLAYTGSGIGAGSLGGTPFSDALVTFTLIGDSDGAFLAFGNTWRNEAIAPVTVSVEGLGTATFLDQVIVFNNQGAAVAGFQDFDSFFDIVDVQNPAFATYTLSTPIGVQGPPLFNPGVAFATDQGNFILTSIDFGFTASPVEATVPEPASLAMLSTGLTALAGIPALRRRRLTSQ